MIDTNTRNKIIEETRELLDRDFTRIIINVEENGFSIIPTKEISEKKGKEKNGK